MSQQEKTYTITGMHCKSCALFITEESKDMVGVKSAVVDISGNTLTVVLDEGDIQSDVFLERINSQVASRGYTIHDNSSVQSKTEWNDVGIALMGAVVCILIFALLQRAGLVNLIQEGNMTFGGAFLIGMIASLSSCLAVVGGLVLSISATQAKEGSGIVPAVLFHAGRLVGFFVLGGVIGSLGAMVQLGPWSTFGLNMFVGVVMLVLGINLLGIFPWFRKFQLAMPTVFGTHVGKLKLFRHEIAPIILGIATFFLPCGFTQSMQVYTLSTGNFIQGALTMFVFALGTLPVLALLSFGVRFAHGSRWGNIFFQAIGFVVIGFAIINILGGLAAAGIMTPVLSF